LDKGQPEAQGPSLLCLSKRKTAEIM